MKTTRKLLLALVLVMSILMTLAVAVIPASAVTLTGGEKLYLVPSSNWNESTPRFAAYFCNGTSAATWVNMNSIGNNVYEVTVPSGNHKNVIFCRMNGSASANNWNNRWNQTADLVFDGTQNLYTVSGWDSGSWSKATCSQIGHAFKDGKCSACSFSQTIYLKPNGNWKADGARFAMYLFNSDSDNTWVGMEAVGTTGLYKATLPNKYYKSVIFCRMNGSASANNWNNKWDQTKNLDLIANNELFTIKDGDWNNADGKWSNHTCTGGTATCTTQATCSVCGNKYGSVNANNHAYGTATYVWSNDYSTCTATKVCGNNANHKVEENATITSSTTASCTEDGKKTYTATFTNTNGFTTQTKQVDDAKKGHNLVDVAGKNATCTEDGYTAYKDCSRCDHIEGKTVIPAAHTPATAVQENVKPATCHATGSYDEVVYCSVEACKHEISRTPKTIDKVAHTPATAVRENEVPATCYATGSYDEVVYCSVEACKYEISRTPKTIDKVAHTPANAVRENEVPASCYAEGSYDEVVYCSVEACKHEISRTPKTIDKVAHTPATAVRENEVPASCYAEGSYDEVVYCSVEACKHEISRTSKTIDKLAHTEDCGHATSEVDGVYYESIVDALEAAKSGDIVTLTQDVDLPEKYLELYATLDLAGHKLTVAGLFNNGRVVDSALTGSLTVKDGGFTFDGIEYQDENGNQLQVPVCVARGDDSNTFVFRAPKAQNKDAVETEGKVVIDFRPSFAGGNYTNTDLFGDGSLDNDVKFEIRVTRTGADGTKTVQLPISQELVQKVYSATNRGIRLTVTGAEEGYTYTIELVIYSCGVTVHNTELAVIPAAPATGDDDEQVNA